MVMWLLEEKELRYQNTHSWEQKQDRHEEIDEELSSAFKNIKLWQLSRATKSLRTQLHMPGKSLTCSYRIICIQTCATLGAASPVIHNGNPSVPPSALSADLQWQLPGRTIVYMFCIPLNGPVLLSLPFCSSSPQRVNHHGHSKSHMPADSAYSWHRTNKASSVRVLLTCINKFLIIVPTEAIWPSQGPFII